MRPIATDGTNAVFGADGYFKLPGQVYTEINDNQRIRCIQTVWELTDEEIDYLLKKKRIYISVVGDSPQPIDVAVEPFVSE